MKAILEYELPTDEEAFNHALHGPANAAILESLVVRLTRIAYPSGDAPGHKGLQVLLRQLEQQMDEAGLNQRIQFPENQGEE
jgi:hypothetical protein